MAIQNPKSKIQNSAPVRLGVVGAGWFASRRHLPDAQADSNVELVALCRRDADSRRTMAEKFGIESRFAFEDWREMLKGAELDAVLIATPNNLHFEQAKAALEAGLHVLLEKPMTIRTEHARELVALADANGLKLSVAVNPPFWAHCHAMRDALRDPDMGALESVSMYWTGSAEYVFGKAPAPDNLPGVVPPTMYRSDPEQNGGGYFADGGPHLVSELLWVSGQKARRVTALMDAAPADMRAVLSIELENGALATIASLGDSKFPGRRVRNTFGASNGLITVQDFAFETVVAIQGREPQHCREADLPPVGTPVGNFAQAILGHAELLSPGWHGADVVAVTEAAYRSALEGRTVTLDY